MITRPKEFKRFYNLLMKNAPEGYQPHLFRCGEKSKAPELEYGSWKSEENRLSGRGAIKWMRRGKNIGIAGMPDDELVNIDIDDEEKTTKDDLKKTLMARSRSRTGLHAWYFSEDSIPNIPTDDCGEIRSQGQYVVAPGSYVPSEKDLTDAGYYTIEMEKPVSSISIDELPEVFEETRKKNEKKSETPESKINFDPEKNESGHSALYEIEARDVVSREGGSINSSDRWTAIFHDSSTDQNMSFGGGLLHCWRHGVSLNGLMALVVLSGLMTCRQAGSPHKNSGAGPSEIINNDEAILEAWLYAKKHGYIPQDDPMPVRALNYVAKIEEIYNAEEGEMLPAWAYNRTLEIVEDEY